MFLPRRVSIPQGSSRRIGGYSLAVLALAVALTGCAVFGVSEEEAAPVRIGEVFDGSIKLTRAVDKSRLMIPSGEVTFGVTEPLDRVGWDEWIGTEERVPADGAEIIAVTWKRTGVFTDDVADAMTGDGPPKDPIRMWVVADGGHHEIEDVGSLGGPGERNFVYVGVPAGADVALEVEYDGLKQSVDARTGRVDSGVAAGLYDESLLVGSKTGSGRTSCANQRTTSGRWAMSFTCGVESVWSLPYASRRGWADKDESWLILTARTNLIHPAWTISRRRFATYTAHPSRWQVTVDGARPTAVLGSYGKEASTLRQLVFARAAVGNHRVRFDVSYSLRVATTRSTGGKHPKSATQTMVREVAIPG